MRLAIIDDNKCQPKKCSRECYKYCPLVRMGEEAIVFDEKPIISEILCNGCGICIKKCPYGAIRIIKLAEELKYAEVHRYGPNAFALYGLPIPKHGKVTGIAGRNGTGKTTVMKILSGLLKPNLGGESTWNNVIRRYAGSELQSYFRKLSVDEIRIAYKPQYVDLIPFQYKGETLELLERVDETGKLDELTRKFDIHETLRKDITELSGGELQRVAIVACMLRDADVYLFDEVTPYLDVYQRIKAAKQIRDFTDKTVMVVEHDLAILDLLADVVHITYGEPGAYGIVSYPKGVRVGINEYLRGFLSKENVRIRPESIEFRSRMPSTSDSNVILRYEPWSKRYDDFELKVNEGEIKEGVTGVIGPNGIGKTTFAKTLAGIITPTHGDFEKMRISYKPQYPRVTNMSVSDLLRSVTDEFAKYYESEILEALGLEGLLDRNISDLSGGELQKVAIAECLSRDADLYILDEPSAHLDVEERLRVIKAVRRYAKNREKSVMVIDHDVYLIDLLSDRLMVFSGSPGRNGDVSCYEMAMGMNKFLSDLEITFRRDESGRPRVNKLGSRLDREQKKSGDYYYAC